VGFVEIAKWVVAILGTLLAVLLFIALFTGQWVIGGFLIGAFTALNTMDVRIACSQFSFANY
jgi:hypothetical protein